MKRTMCSRCGVNPAVIFISKVEDGKTTPEGLCIKCARELNIGPVKQIMDQMGISDDDIDMINDQFNSIMGFNGEDGDDSFDPGGAAAIPNLENLFGALELNSDGMTSEDGDDGLGRFVGQHARRIQKRQRMLFLLSRQRRWHRRQGAPFHGGLPAGSPCEKS